MRLTRMPWLRSGRLRSHFLFTCCGLALLCQALGIVLSSCEQVGSACEAYPPLSVASRLFVTGGRLYLSSQGSGLLAVQTSSGQQVWQTSGILEATGVSQIYLGTSSTSASLLLEALRASNGKPLWHATESENTEVLGELDQVLYLYNPSTATLVALSAFTGSVRWQAPVIRPPTSYKTSTVAVQVSASVVYLLSPSGH